MQFINKSKISRSVYFRHFTYWLNSNTIFPNLNTRHHIFWTKWQVIFHLVWERKRTSELSTFKIIYRKHEPVTDTYIFKCFI